MKKTLCFVLALMMAFSMVACQTIPIITTTEGTETAPATTPASTGLPGIPEGFCAGFARVNINPQLFPVTTAGNDKANGVADNLYATCVAVSDGDEVALFISTDLKRTVEKVYQNVAKQIEREIGVPADHIFITATHTHNAPEQESTSDGYIAKWLNTILYPRLKEVARKAYEDLAPAQFSGGTADTTGFAFVRRYICADGSLDGAWILKPSAPAIRHETEADPELQVLKITREGDKKDIVMVNWQAHAAHAVGTYPSSLSADFVGILRNGVENQTGALFSYYNGASGNLNLSTKFRELVKYTGYGWQDVGHALVGKTVEAMNNATPLATGEIKVATGSVEGVLRSVDPDQLAKALEIKPLGWTSAAAEAMMIQYGFHSKYHANMLIVLDNTLKEREAKNLPAIDTIPLYAITFGEIAFAGAPYEMFDTNGMQIKDSSPAKMTFICAYTNGSMGYFPSEGVYDRGGYEAHVTSYVKGTAELCETELLRLINATA